MEPENAYVNGEYVSQKRGGGKRKRIIFALVLAALAVNAVVIVCLLQFMNKTPATPDEFIAAVEERGLAWTDNLNVLPSEDRAFFEAAIYAAADRWQAEFYQLTGTGAAMQVFSSTAGTFETQAWSPISRTSVSANGYASLSLTAPNGTWYFISCIDSTVVIAIADESYKAEAKDFIKALGY